MYLLLDIGGSELRIAISADGSGITLGPKIIENPKNFEAAMDIIRNTVETLAKGAKIDKIAAGVAGSLDEKKSKIFVAPNLPDFIGKPIKERLQEDFNAPVLLENDASLNGLGEAVFGSGKGHDIVAYLTISTGVGGD